MSRAIVWSRRALGDLKAQIDLIERHSPNASRAVLDRIEAAIGKLAFMPAGRPGRYPGSMERYVEKTSLVIAFKLKGDHELRILRIVHAARHWPQGAWPAD